MAQTIRRSGKGVRRAAAAKGAQRKVATAKKQTGNVIDGVMQWLPFSEETLHRIVLAVILGAGRFGRRVRGQARRSARR